MKQIPLFHLHCPLVAPWRQVELEGSAGAVKLLKRLPGDKRVLTAEMDNLNH